MRIIAGKERIELDSGNADSARPFYVASLLVKPCCGKMCINNVQLIYLNHYTKYIHSSKKVQRALCILGRVERMSFLPSKYKDHRSDNRVIESFDLCVIRS